MADEEQTVRGVSWKEVFGFSHIFKSFKMAIHPGKILLALLAIALTWAFGVFVMDPIWSGASASNRVMDTEAWTLWTSPSRTLFCETKQKWVKEGRGDSLERKLRNFPAITDKPATMAKESFSSAVGKLQEKYEEAYEEKLKALEKAYEEKLEAIKPEAKDKAEQKRAAKRQYRADRQAALTTYITSNRNLRANEGGRIFASFLDWQDHCLRSALAAVRRGNFATGLDTLRGLRGSGEAVNFAPAEFRVPATSNLPGRIDAGTNDPEGFGVLAWLGLMAWGVWWMVATYPVYSLIYVVVALAVWSFLGGAICRIAALHAAREEKISMVAALKFSCSKFLSLFCAPLMPLAFIVILGLCLALAGLVGSIPGFGEWAYVLLFLLPVIAGAVVAFLTVGLVGGAPLMWPTIAVEGSDGFDAFSRSFSYIFARPFRYGLYWVVAAVYGTICYLFVRLFAFIGLRAIHCWSGWAMGLAGRDTYATGAGKLDVMWAKPTFGSFHGPMQWEAMGGSEAAASVILSAWVYLISGIVLAFLACFVLSAATNIYFLLRQRVDATDLDDVYIEEAEEEEPAPPAPEGAEEQPPEEKPPNRTRKRPNRLIEAFVFAAAALRGRRGRLRGGGG